MRVEWWNGGISFECSYFLMSQVASDEASHQVKGWSLSLTIRVSLQLYMAIATNDRIQPEAVVPEKSLIVYFWPEAAYHHCLIPL